MPLDDAVARASWDDLRQLEALDRLGSVPAAGRELGVSTSTVYRRVRALEAAIGFACLTRAEGLTGPGRELAALVRSMSHELSRITRRATACQRDVSGVVTLTTVEGFSDMLIAPLAELARTCPALRVNLHVSHRGLSLHQRQADIALSVVHHPRAELVGRRLFTIRFGVFGTPELAARPANARWIVLGWPLHSTSEARWERANVPEHGAAISTPSREAFVKLVAGGVGLGLLPRRLAAAHPDLVEVESHRASLVGLTRPTWLLTHPELRDHARVAAVLEVLTDHLAE